MQEQFMACFNQNNIEITLDGQCFDKDQCQQIAEGSQKTVYSIQGKDICFFIPNKAYYWEHLITGEKEISDYILSLGLRAQKFEIKPMTIKNKDDGSTYTLDVLVTKSFNSLMNEENIVICDPKNQSYYDTNYQKIEFPKDQEYIDTRCIINKPFELFAGDRNNFLSTDWNSKLFEALVDEYAMAYTYKLPINQLKSNDDSEHYYFEAAKDNNTPPKAHYFFWDIYNDFSKPEFPEVPSLKNLKYNLDKWYHKETDKIPAGINFTDIIVNSITNVELSAMGYNNFVDCLVEYRRVLVQSISDEMLERALTKAREHAEKYMTDKINALQASVVADATIDRLVCSTLSIGNESLVRAAIELAANKNHFYEKYSQELEKLRLENSSTSASVKPRPIVAPKPAGLTVLSKPEVAPKPAAISKPVVAPKPVKSVTPGFDSLRSSNDNHPAFVTELQARLGKNNLPSIRVELKN